MSSKRLSVRFDLDREPDRRVWEQLQRVEGTKSKAVISALDAFFSQADLSQVIRDTIRECLAGMTVAPPSVPESSAITPEEEQLMDSLADFLGG